jgi:type II secretory pathway pseudopilin PulG
MTAEPMINESKMAAGSVELRRRRQRRYVSHAAAAFTLIELLIVIALSGLLLALLFTPIVQGLRITNKTRALVIAQDATRFGLEKMERELSSASYVFDNTNTPIELPLEPTGTVTRTQNSGGTQTAIYPSTTPVVAYGRVDFIPVETNAPAGGTPIDPTTGAALGGSSTLLPGAAAGHRFVRYFIGLQHNLNADGTVDYYRNVFEFPSSTIDSKGAFNPFVLYRAEYDPHDPNLIAQSSNGPVIQKTANGDGSMNDPTFFYNTNAANTTDPISGTKGTGTYAANWQHVAVPIVAGANMDMLTWQRGGSGLFDATSPFHLGAMFTAGTVVGDTAAPAFLTNLNAENPSAIPTLYTTKSGEWTVPFSVSVYRGVNNAAPGATGSVTLQFAYNTSSGNLECNVLNASGSLAPTASPKYYCIYSRLTGRYFVSLPTLTMTIDPVRGRIETGMPPLGVDSSGQLQVYLYDSANNLSTAPTAFAGSTSSPITVVQGEVEQTIYRSTTLDIVNANQAIPVTTPGQVIPPGLTTPTQTIPADQGLLFVDLSQSNQASPPSLASVAGYFPTSLSTTPINTGGVTNAGALISPFVAFNGAILALGTERVMGPDDAGTLMGSGASLTILHPYFRTGNNDDLGKGVDSPPQSGNLYTRTSPLNYTLPPKSDFTNRPILEFADNPPLDTTTPAALTSYQQFLAQNLPSGLPVPHSTLPPSSSTPAAEVQVSFLWQNNFARNSNGYPIDVNGKSPFDANQNGQVVPQADVFRVDYGTRSLLSVGLSVEVYDTSSGRPQVSQVTDKIKINNANQH